MKAPIKAPIKGKVTSGGPPPTLQNFLIYLFWGPLWLYEGLGDKLARLCQSITLGNAV